MGARVPPPAETSLVPRWYALWFSKLFDIALGAALALPVAYFVGTPVETPDPIAQFAGRVMLSPLAVAAAVIVTVFASTLYQTALVPLLGGTLGERLAGLAVTRTKDGTKPGVMRAILRGAFGGLGATMLLVGPLYALWLDRKGRDLGDLLAGTRPCRRVKGASNKAAGGEAPS